MVEQQDLFYGQGEVFLWLQLLKMGVKNSFDTVWQ